MTTVYNCLWGNEPDGGGHEVVAGTPVEKAVKDNGLDWDVLSADIPSVLPPLTSNLITSAPGFLPAEVARRVNESPILSRLLYRSHNRQVIPKSHGLKYNITPNAQIFEVAAQLQANGLATVESIGSIRKECGVWAFCRLNLTYELDGDDSIQPYLLLYNGHDALTKAGGAIVDVRYPSCLVLRSCALSDRDSFKWSAQAYDSAAALIQRQEQEDSKADYYQKMQSYALDTPSYGAILRQVFPNASTATAATLFDLEVQSVENSGHYTPWGFLNAVAAYYTTKGTLETTAGEIARSRLNSIWFMEGMRRLEAVHDVMESLVTAVV